MTRGGGVMFICSSFSKWGLTERVGVHRVMGACLAPEACWDGSGTGRRRGGERAHLRISSREPLALSEGLRDAGISGLQRSGGETPSEQMRSYENELAVMSLLMYKIGTFGCRSRRKFHLIIFLKYNMLFN